MTEAIISITEDGRVVLKIVAGCDGYNAKEVVKRLLDLYDEDPSKLTDLKFIRKMAIDLDFGDDDCLVVMSEDGALGPGGDDLPPMYRETFDDPKANPRRDEPGGGVAEYTIVIDMGYIS